MNGWMIGNKEIGQTQLTTHYGLKNPLGEKLNEVQKMGSLKQEAEEYTPQETKNIADLEKVSVEIEVHEKTAKNDKDEEFTYKYIIVEEDEYRVPYVVLKQLKAQIEADPELKFFSVVKEGEGLKTQYTVIPGK